jgi:hypothetical protein
MVASDKPAPGIESYTVPAVAGTIAVRPAWIVHEAYQRPGTQMNPSSPPWADSRPSSGAQVAADEVWASR